jgi:4-alpha-glucanotransferase
MKKRGSGILLHITSLPSKYGIGDLGPQAYRFADFLSQAKQSYWQVLPLNPPRAAKYQSPYSCLSAFAGNTLLISPEVLHRRGLISKRYLRDAPRFRLGRVDYERAAAYKAKLFDVAFRHFQASAGHPDFEAFCDENSHWLEDYATFTALCRHFGSSAWWRWPRQIRDRKKRAIASLNHAIREAIEKEKSLQYLFFTQWLDLKRYCNNHGVQIIGDVPIYIARESADVWAHPEIFKLTKDKRPRVVAGVPPDLFSKTGQLWGNPIYDWRMLKKRDFSWWMQRIGHNLTVFDVVRIDHFRGFVAYWQVPASHKTARNGKWVQAPKDDFFNMLFKHFAFPPIIVEDLGHITPDVREVVDRLQLPCMKVLLFAFGKDNGKNRYLPHHHVRNCVVYTGTHDNNTIKGWFTKEATPAQKKALFAYLGRKVPASQIHWELIRLAMSSVANTAIVPMQDVLGLGQEARMNRPATVTGNWVWRLKPGQTTNPVTTKLAQLTRIYGRM